jgi:tRNA(Arg) A34 adenosine deaminase TadA
MYSPEEKFMRLAIAEAQGSRRAGDYAIGAVVVRDGSVLASSGNRIKLECDPTQHAEVAAIRLACASLRTRHLEGAVLYTTVEPCPMCAAAAIWARMSGIVSGSTIEDMAEFRQKFGNPEWTWRTVDIAARSVLEQGEPKLFFVEGFLRQECRCLFHTSGVVPHVNM